MPKLKVIVQEHTYCTQNSAGKYKDDDALHDVLSYCGRYGKASCVDGIGVYLPNAIFEMERLAQAYGQTQGVRLRHWILSFSKDELRQFNNDNLLTTLHHFGLYAASHYGWQYQIVFSIHLDTDDPHIHFVMNTVNYRTGKKYPGNKADYYDYQDYLSNFFNCYGMELETVPDRPSMQIPQELDG